MSQIFVSKKFGTSTVVLAGLVTLVPLGVSRQARGAGFQINEHAAPATGRASAVTATVDDPSAIWHNPAGLTETAGTEFMVGLTFIRPRGRYVGPGLPSTNPDYPADAEGNTNSSIVPVPYAYVSRALSSKAFVGFGFYLPYGLGVEWEDPERFVLRTIAQDTTLRTYFLTPAIALKLSDAVSVALGVSLVPATVYLKRTVGAPDTQAVLLRGPGGEEGELEVSGSAFGVGMTAGLMVTLVDHLKLGFNYRSAVGLSFSGDANFILPPGTPAEIAANFPDQGGEAELTLPHTFGFGVGWKDSPLTLELAAQITLWNSYDELTLNFETGRPSPSSTAPRDWKVVPLIRAGGQYEFGDAVARLGVAYDISPIPTDRVEPSLPDNDRFIWTIGAGYRFGAVRLDLSYMFLYVRGRSVQPEDNNPNSPIGTYAGGIVHLLSTSVGVEI